MNQKSIAKQAGVSVATVSRVLNGYAGVSEKTKQKVLTLLDANAYVLNNNARNLRMAKSKTIGFLISNFSNPFFNSIYQGLEPVCREKGYSIVIGNTNESAEQEREVIDLFLSYRVAGIIASFVDPHENTIKKLDNYGTNILALDRHKENISADTVTMDNVHGAQQQVEYLAGLGHKCIALIHGPLTDVVASERYKGYVEGCKKHNIKPASEYMFSGDFNEAEAYLATIKLLSLTPRPTAIVVHNNLMTIGAYKAIQDMHLQIPNDISIIGFEDFDIAEYLKPGLTMIERSLHQTGEVSGRMIIERIENVYTEEPRVVSFPAQLKVRDSCAPPEK